MGKRGRPRYPDVLTPREQEVLGLLREGLTNEQIAWRLNVSPATAKYHVSEILSKLGVGTREEAAAWVPGAEGEGWTWRRWVMVGLGSAVVVGAVLALGLLAWGVWVTGDGSEGGAEAVGATTAVRTPGPTASPPTPTGPLRTPAPTFAPQVASGFAEIEAGVWRFDPDTGELVNLAARGEGGLGLIVALSSDGGTLAFAERLPGEVEDGSFDPERSAPVFVKDLTSGAPAQEIAVTTYTEELSLSADGARLITRSPVTFDPSSSRRIDRSVVTETATGEARWLQPVGFPVFEFGSTFRWSPDGSTVLLKQFQNPPGIRVIALTDNLSVASDVSGTKYPHDFTWLDADTFAVCTPFGITLVHMPGDTEDREAPPCSRNLQASRDGAYVAYDDAVGEGDSSGIVILSLADGTVRRFPGAGAGPWSPGGDRLLFADPSAGLFTRDVETGAAVSLLQTPGGINEAYWLPDGTIVFVN